MAAGSVADDLNHIALADISRALESQTADYRVIAGHGDGGCRRSDLGTSFYRESLDADLEVLPIVARDLDIAGRL